MKQTKEKTLRLLLKWGFMMVLGFYMVFYLYTSPLGLVTISWWWIITTIVTSILAILTLIFGKKSKGFPAIVLGICLLFLAYIFIGAFG